MPTGKRWRAAAGCVALLALAGTALAQESAARESLEAALRAARPGLPKSAQAYGRALAAMVSIDPRRAATLIREAALLRPSKGPGTDSVEYWLIQNPLSQLATRDFHLALDTALQHPGRMLPHLASPFGAFMRAQPQESVAAGRRMMAVAPREGADLIRSSVRWYSGGVPLDLVRLLPRGSNRAVLPAGLGAERLGRDRSGGIALLREAMAEHPHGGIEAESRLFMQGRASYPQLPEARRNTPPAREDWLRLATPFRDLPTEAGLAGLAVAAAAHQPQAALEIARSIQDQGLRALGLAGILPYLRQNGREDPAGIAFVAAREAAALYPRLQSPSLRYVAADWLGPALPPREAVPILKAGLDAVARMSPDSPGLFGTATFSAEVLTASLLRRLAEASPAEARGEARRRRRVLGSFYRTAILNCAALHPSVSEALAWLRVDLGRDSDARQDYALLAAEAAPGRILAFARTLPAGYRRDMVLYTMVSGLAAGSPREALALAPLFAGRIARSAAFDEAVDHAFQQPLEARLLLAGAIPDPEDRADTIADVLESGSLSGGTVARQVVEKYAGSLPPGGPKWRLMGKVCESLAPVAALAYAAKIGGYSERLEAQKEALHRMAEGDRAAALAWVRAQQDAETRTDLLTALATDIASSDPAEAVRIAADIPHRPSRVQVILVAIHAWRESELDRALHLAAGLSAREVRDIPEDLVQDALRRQRPPALVWPLFRGESDRFGWRWGLRSDLSEAARRDPRGAFYNAVAAWVAGFPRSEWLPALLQYFRLPKEEGIEPWFVLELVRRLAPSHEDDAVALVEGCGLGDDGWTACIQALLSDHPARASGLYPRLRAAGARLRIAAQLLAAAPADRPAAEARLQEAATRQAAEAEALAPEAATRALEAVFRTLRGAGLPSEAILRRARAAAARIPDAVTRAERQKALQETR